MTNAEIFQIPKIAVNITGVGAAVIPTAKLTQYALNPAKDANKARAFEEALGYNLDNVEKLVENLQEHLNEGELTEKPDNGYGKRFQIVVELEGENGKRAKVLTAWLIDKDTGEVRLTTIHIDK